MPKRSTPSPRATPGRRRDPFEPAIERAARRKSEPFPFVLDELAELDVRTRPMFGCLAVYVRERIVFVLRDKGPGDADSGVWVVFEPEHFASLHAVLPDLEPIAIFGDKVRGWKKLSAQAADFEQSVLTACALVVGDDPRIGKVPGTKGPKRPRSPKAKPKAEAMPKAAPKRKAR